MDIWILLADTRQKLLKVWLTFTATFIALFLIMTLAGKFEGIIGLAWLWAFVIILPILALLYIGVAMNPQPSKVIKKASFQVLFYGAMAYLFLVLATLLGMQAWLSANSEESVLDYLQMSYLWILPFQVVLLVAIWILYFTKTKLLQPNEKILLEYAEKKADYAQRFGSLPQKTAFDALLKNDYPSVFELLKKNLTDNQDRNFSLILQGQYTNLTEKQGFNIIEPADAQREFNRITMALVDIIEKI